MRTINQLSNVFGLIVAAVLLLAGTRCEAQRGVGTTFAVERQSQTAATSLFALAPAPVRQVYLAWDNPPGASNRVAWGRVRNAWTNGVATISTNRFPITNGWAYKVTAIVDGMESVPALWPSNRIAELWLRGHGTNMSNGTNIVRLVKFTNAPPGNMQFWGVANVTTGWE